MKVLSFTAAGPLQSWGIGSQFNYRNTAVFPTYSGIIGLIANAAGIERDDQNGLHESGLLNLHLAVRADQPGILTSDYQTIALPNKTKLATKEYLADAVFLIVMHSEDDEALATAEAALSSPKNLLFLGRKNCPPSVPLIATMKECESLERHLETEPYKGTRDSLPRKERQQPELVRMAQIEAPGDPTATYQQDVPITYSSTGRSYAARSTRLHQVTLPNPYHLPAWNEPLQFDPLAIAESA